MSAQDPSARILQTTTLIILCQSLSVGCIFIPLPSLILSLYDGDASAASWFAGLALAIGAFLQIFSNAAMGSMSDRAGRKVFASVSVFGVFLSLVTIAIGMNLTSVIVSTIIRGCTDATYTIAAAVVGDLSQENALPTNYGRLGAAQGVGVIIGPLLSAAMSQFGPLRLQFALGAAVQTITLALTFGRLRESLGRPKAGVTLRIQPRGSADSTTIRVHPAPTPQHKHQPSQHSQREPVRTNTNTGVSQTEDSKLASARSGVQQTPRSSLRVVQPEQLYQTPRVEIRPRTVLRSGNPFGTLRILKNSPFLLLLALALFFNVVTASGVLSIIFVYTHTRYNWSDADASIFVFGFAILAVLAQAVFLPYMFKPHRLGDSGTVNLSATCYSLIFVVFGIAPTSSVFWIGLVFFMGLATLPSLRACITREIPPAQQGELQGALTFLSAAATVVGPLSISGIFSLFVSDSSPAYFPGAAFFACLIINCISQALILLAFCKFSHTRNDYQGPASGRFLQIRSDTATGGALNTGSTHTLVLDAPPSAINLAILNTSGEIGTTATGNSSVNTSVAATPNVASPTHATAVAANITGSSVLAAENKGITPLLAG